MVDASQLRSLATLNRFYSAFRELDGKTMQACYAPDASFEDPVFTLQGRDRAGGMWRMLCESVKAKSRDAWRLDFHDLAADATGTGRAHWEARYLFGATGRHVHNRIDAVFTFDPAGLIVTHRECFDFWAWSRQAFGAPGVLLGWTPWLRGRVRAQAAGRLDVWLARPPPR
jgi:ketosteroid isomerase-like protein